MIAKLGWWWDCKGSLLLFQVHKGKNRGGPQNGWWKKRKTLLKWMIWRENPHYFRKHPYICWFQPIWKNMSPNICKGSLLLFHLHKKNHGPLINPSPSSPSFPSINGTLHRRLEACISWEFSTPTKTSKWRRGVVKSLNIFPPKKWGVSRKLQIYVFNKIKLYDGLNLNCFHFHLSIPWIIHNLHQNLSEFDDISSASYHIRWHHSNSSHPRLDRCFQRLSDLPQMHGWTMEIFEDVSISLTISVEILVYCCPCSLANGGWGIWEIPPNASNCYLWNS